MNRGFSPSSSMSRRVIPYTCFCLWLVAFFLAMPAKGQLNEWTLLSDYPPGLTTKSTIAFGSSVVVFPEGNVNDWDAEQRLMDHVYVLSNINTFDWKFQTTKENAPIVRDDYCTALVGNQAFLFGGLTDSFLSDVSALDLKSYTWSMYTASQSARPRGRRFPYCFNFNGNFAVYGGLGPISTFSDLWTFNSTSAIWTRLSASKGPVSFGGASAVFSDALYIYSGREGNTVSNNLWKLDIKTLSWSSTPILDSNSSPLSGVYQASHALVGSNLFVFFGLPSIDSSTPLTKLFSINLVTSQVSFEADTMNIPSDYPYGSSFPLPRFKSSAVPIGNKIVLSGGIHKNIEDTIFVYDTSSNTWSDNSMNYYPIARSASSSCVVDSNTLAIFGGYTNPLGTLTYLNDLWMFAKDTRKWTSLSNLAAYTTGTISNAPPGLRRSTLAFYQGAFFVIGGDSDMDIYLTYGFKFDTTSKTWSSFAITGPANGIFQAFGQATGVVGDALYIWGGLNLNQTSQDARSSVIVLSLTTLKSLIYTGGSSALAARYAASGFVFGGATFCVQGGGSDDFDVVSPTNFFVDIFCFRPSSNSWFSFPYSMKSYPQLSFTSFAFVGSGILTGGIDSYGDNTFGTWIYDFSRKTWGQYTNPSKRPGRFSKHSSLGVGSYIVALFANIGSSWDNRVYGFNTGTMFCYGVNELASSGSSLNLDDGSGLFGYMPNTNCTWVVSGVNNLVVNQFAIDANTKITLSVDSQCGDNTISIAGNDVGSSNTQLTGLSSSTSINIPSSQFRLSFMSSANYGSLSGFTFSALNCPKGFSIQSSRCVCNLDHYITPSDECYPCETGTFQVFQNMHYCQPRGLTITSSTNYFINATLGNWRFVNETLPTCLSSSSATFGGTAYFFCMFGGESPKETDFIPVSVFTLSQISNSRWKYEVPTSSVPLSRLDSCTLSGTAGIYYVGGRAPSSDHRYTYLYNPTTRKWSQLSLEPFDISGQACFITGDSIITHGGENRQGEIVSSVFRYSIVNNTWVSERWANSPSLTSHGAWVYASKLFFYGGYDGIQEMNSVYRGDLSSRTWTGPIALNIDKCAQCEQNGRSCTIARQGMGITSIGSKVFIYGGIQRSSVFRELIVLESSTLTIVDFAAYSAKDFFLESAPPASYGNSIGYMGTNIFIFGGYGTKSSSPMSLMWNYDTVEKTWFGSNQAYAPLPRRDFAATNVTTFGFAIFGGYVRSSQEYLSNDAWIFNRRISQWVRLASYGIESNKPAPRSNCGMSYFANYIYVFGGTSLYTERNLIWRLDISRPLLQNALEVSTNWQALSLLSSLAPNSNILLRSGFSSVIIKSVVWMWGGEMNIDQGVAEDYRASFTLDLQTLRISSTSPQSENPIPRTDHAAAVLFNSYCIHGGQDFGGRILSDMWCFDSVSGNWTRKDSPYNPEVSRMQHSMASIGTDLVIHGGLDANGVRNQDAYMFQFATSRWIRLAMGTSSSSYYDLSSHFASSFGDQVIIFGGQGNGFTTNQIAVYRPGLCNSAVPYNITSSKKVTIFEDQSEQANIPAGTTCRWFFNEATHIMVNFTLAAKDKITVSENVNGANKVVFTSTSATGNSDVISAMARGLTVTLSSTNPITSNLQGQFVKVLHIGCPLGARVRVDYSCYCLKGYYENEETNECSQCKSPSDSPDCASDSGGGLSSSTLGAIIGGTCGAFIIFGFVGYKQYEKKMKVMKDREQQMFAKISFDELEFGKMLGAGSFGEVFIASWRGSQVAVKRLNYSKMTRAALKEFESEVSTMVQLRHPNVVLYMGAVVEPPNLCILSELMTRGSLYDVLHNESIDLEYSQRLSFLIDAAKGLQYLHMCVPPMLHRDLKSPNLLLDEKWNLKISDFGLTGAKGHNTTDEPTGTLLWMAPEVIMAQAYVEGSDVFSFAIIMWEVFTRNEPYQGDLAESVAIRVAQEGYRPALPPIDQMPEEVQKVMIKGWDQDISGRPTFKEILRDLNAANGEYSATQSAGSSMKRTSTMSAKRTKEVAPTGKVALVFTDVQGSTSIWEKYPEEMSEALVMHNELLRGVIRRNNGYEVKTEGDAFMITFDSVKKAASFCLQAQETLLAAIWPEKIMDHPAACIETSKGVIIFRGIRVRMGIHYGEPLCREDPITGRMDYFGPVVNRAARVGGFPRGGQVAISEPAYTEIASELESIGSPVIRDLGEHLLKGLNVPDHLYEILPVSLADRSIYYLNNDGSSSNSSSTLTVPNSNMPDGSQRSAKMPQDNFSWQVDFEEIQITNTELGAGSYGVVFLGQLRNEQVAVKRFSKQKVGEKQYFELLAEIMLLRDLDHPKILKLIAACLKPPNICMVMEYAKHGSLRTVLDNPQMQLNVESQRSIMKQVASAMRYLHARNPPIYHRDLKSPNILICEDNPFVAKIADFGLARVKADNQTMTKCGTKGWLAPEVLKGLRYNEKADVYSFGIMIWEVVTRQKPYSGMDPLKLNFEVVSGLRPPVPKSGDSLLVEIMKQSWSGDPTLRPSFESIEEKLSGDSSSTNDH